MDDLTDMPKTNKAWNLFYSNDIRLEFGICKYAVLTLRKGKAVESFGTVLPYGEERKSLKERESYKYLGVLEEDRFKYKEIKEMVGKEYLWRVKKVLESRLNGGNLITAINTQDCFMAKICRRLR